MVSKQQIYFYTDLSMTGATARLLTKAISIDSLLIALLVLVLFPQIAFPAAIKIMPLGDSITVGANSGVNENDFMVSYRKSLRDKLVGAGYDVDFVGSQLSGNEVFGDSQHEGHGGWYAAGVPDSSILPRVYGFLEAFTPNIVLLHIGTNDISVGQAPASIADEIDGILGEVDTFEEDYNKDVWVVLARIVNRANGCVNRDQTTSLNNSLDSIVDARWGNGDRISAADMENSAGLDYRIQPTGNMYDCLHPYATGYEKMAEEWFQGLKEILPTARAGNDRNANPGVTVTLDGSGSTDSLGAIVSYSWIQTVGAAVTLANPNAAQASFTAPSINGGTSLTFKLTITDEKAFSHSDECSITVNGPPIAAAGTDQVVNTGEIVTLDGAGSTDPGGAVQSYQWQQTAGSPIVSLSGANTAKATFTAPPAGSGGVDLAFKLTVTDNMGAQDEDTCNVHVNGPPVADAGADQQVSAGAVVVLDGTRSSDADGSIAVYRWAQAGGSPAVGLIGADTPRATFTAPEVGNGVVGLTFQLTVTDNLGVQNVDSAVVQIRERPTANAGPDQEVETESIVVLDGSGSAGAGNGVLSYAWVQTSGPLVSLSSSVAVKPVFSAPSGIKTDVTLTFLLTVTDTGGLQSTDSCTVTVIPEDSSSGSSGGGGGGGCFITTAGDRRGKGSARENF